LKISRTVLYYIAYLIVCILFGAVLRGELLPVGFVFCVFNLLLFVVRLGLCRCSQLSAVCPSSASGTLTLPVSVATLGGRGSGAPV